ncbi:MAG: lipid-binding SYLF domain-containing protein [Sulfurovum sp.]|nr:lipid-binding SYLF domain-containing protein [Sulfurovum sp.]
MKKMNALLITLLLTLLFTQTSAAKTVQEMEKEVDFAIEKFKQEVQGGEKFLSKVKGYLVLPSVIKGGFIVGGKYGEGALRVKGKTKFYLSMSAASIGLQAGAQEYSMVIAFITESALKSFYKGNGWEAGVDGSITVAEWGVSKDISSISFEKPIVAFIYGEKGLMAGVSIAGTKFEQITP